MGLGKTYSTQYLLDSNNNSGVAGQVLLSTATGINWSDGSGIIGGPYLPLVGGTLSGNLTMDDSDILFEHSDGSNYYRLGIGASANFEIYNTNYGRTDLLITQSTGNVGIGTTSPGSRKLMISTSDSANDIGLEVNMTRASGGNYAIRGLASGAGSATSNVGGFFNAIGATENTALWAYQGKVLLCTQNATDYVGIGTDIPDVKLDVRNGELIVRPGASGFGGAGKIGHSSSNAILQLYDSSANEKVRISTSLSSYFNGGNVGIGTTLPDSKLDVTGGDITVNTSGIGFMNFKYGSVGSEGVIGSIQTDGIDLKINATSDLLLLPGSNVGIGTTGPTAKLFVDGKDASNNSSLMTRLDTTYAMGISNEWVSTYVSKLQLGRVGIGNTSNIDFIYDISGTEYGSIKRNYTASSLKFERGTTVDMIINGSGNVGIGNTNPLNKLSIEASNTGTQATTIPVGKFYNTGNLFSKLILGSDNANFDGVVSMDNNSTLADTKLRIYIGNGTSATTGHSNDHIVLQGNGNVGIGTISPAANLEVNANSATLTQEILKVKGGGSGGNFGFLVEANNGDDLFKVDCLSYNSYFTNGNVGIGTTSPGSKLTVNGSFSADTGSFSNSLTLSSDLRLQNNITILNKAQSAYISFATRNTTGSEVVMDLTNVGSINGGAAGPYLPLSAGSSYPLTGNLFINNGFTLSWGADTTKIAGNSSTNALSLITASTTRMRITSTGNVGIGTTSPDTTLEVQNPTLATDTVNTLLTQRWSRLQTGAVKWGNSMDLLLGSYESGTINSRTRVDFKLANGATDDPDTTVMTLQANGNVGIGTTSPDSTLTLGNATSNVAELRVLRSNALSTNYAFINTVGGTAQIGGSADTRILSVAATASLLFNTNGVDRLRLVYDGQFWLKLNATTSGYEGAISNDNDKLQIFGSRFGGTGKYVSIWSDGANENARFYPTNTVFYKNVGINATSPNSRLDVRRAGSGVALELHQTSGSANDYVDLKMVAGNTNAGTFGTILRHKRDGSGGGDFSILTNPTLTGTPTEKLTVKSNGNVGIGTDSPAVPLDVEGKIRSSNDNSGEYLEMFNDGDVSGNSFIKSTSGQLILESANDITFSTNASEKMRIEGGGKVGIGTTSLAADSILTLGTTASTGLTLLSVSNAGESFINFADTADVNAGRIYYGHGDNAMRFRTNDGLRMIINSTGDVGIGNTLPQHKLDVAGTIRSYNYRLAGNTTNPTTTAATIYDQSTVGLTLSAHNIELRNYNGSAMARSVFFTHNTATFTGTCTATNFILSSDKTLKDKIKDIETKHVDVEWKNFELKSEPGVKRSGVIAQELEKKHPEFVRTDDEGLKSVAYIDLLISKIAELEARLEKAGL